MQPREKKLKELKKKSVLCASAFLYTQRIFLRVQSVFFICKMRYEQLFLIYYLYVQLVVTNIHSDELPLQRMWQKVADGRESRKSVEEKKQVR